MSQIEHADEETGLNTEAAKTLLRIVESIERMVDEKAEIAVGIKEAFAYAKDFGFEVAALRAVLTIRRQDRKARAEAEAMVQLYLNALDVKP